MEETHHNNHHHYHCHHHHHRHHHHDIPRPLLHLRHAAILGGINFLGVGWLRWALNNGVVPAGPITPLIRFITSWLLAPYAVLYLAIPCVRYALLILLNMRVRVLNERRAALCSATAL